MVSSVIQLCKIIRELAYNSRNPNQRDKVNKTFTTVCSIFFSAGELQTEFALKEQQKRSFKHKCNPGFLSKILSFNFQSLALENFAN